MTGTRLDLLIEVELLDYIAYFACNSCRSTAVLTGTSNNQATSIKSESWWSADITPYTVA